MNGSTIPTRVQTCVQPCRTRAALPTVRKRPFLLTATPQPSAEKIRRALRPELVLRAQPTHVRRGVQGPFDRRVGANGGAAEVFR